jgi:hypothetical protein
MAIQADVGVDPLYFSGDNLLLEFTVGDGDSPGNPRDLSGVTGITWVLAKKQGGAPLVTKTLGSGVSSPLDATGRVDVQIDNADTNTLKGTLYHELQVDNGPQTAAFGDFIIQDDSAAP